MAESESFDSSKRHVNPQNDEFEEEEEDDEGLSVKEEDDEASQLNELHEQQLAEDNQHNKGLQVISEVESNEGTKLKEEVEVSHHKVLGSIAAQDAKGHPKIIHKDIKSANILLFDIFAAHSVSNPAHIGREVIELPSRNEVARCADGLC